MHLAIIGCGNMGRAILDGVLRAGVLSPAMITVAEPDAARRETCTASGVKAEATAQAALSGLTPSDAILLAIKPQLLSQVCAPVGAVGGLVISIMAGVSTARLQSLVAHGALPPRVVRIMPNLCVQARLGMSAVSPGRHATPADVAFATSLFTALGQTVPLTEDLMDAFTAVAGSGPAYLFALAHALEGAAVSLGFDAPTAAAIVRQTIIGSAALLQSSDLTPAALRDAVTSKGGTTAAALAVLNNANLDDVFKTALTAARDRGRELSSLAGS